MSAIREPLPDGRWHFQHGPIDIVIGAEGEAEALAAAHESAWKRFEPLLDELVAELRTLRRPVRGPCPLRGRVAQRMWWACRPYHSGFITPMAAVAGSVAQELVEHYERVGITRAWVNNGGDIALHLAPKATLRIGVFADLGRIAPDTATPGALFSPTGALHTDAHIALSHEQPARGVATSGWRGRSFSLGIADSVTVLAATAADADAAATVIANAVNVADPRIERRPAQELKDDCDLGELPVTVNVPHLELALVRQALQAGWRRACRLRADGLIVSALLVCQGWCMSTPGRAQVQTVPHGGSTGPALGAG
jgi:uncharacterized protein